MSLKMSVMYFMVNGNGAAGSCVRALTPGVMATTVVLECVYTLNTA